MKNEVGNSTRTGPAALTDRAPEWLLHPRTAMLSVPISIGVFWVVESFVHVYALGEGTSVVFEALHPRAHELWMRMVVISMLLVIGGAWYIVADEHRRRLESMRAYQGKLQRMTGRLVYGESEERRDLARRLHEDISQQLTAARMFLSSSSCAETDTQSVRTISRILERVVLECRDLAEELSPPVLEEFGLVPALESLAARVMRRSGASVQVNAEATCSNLGREETLIVFQVLAEVVEIAAERADTTRVVLGCDERGGRLAFTVSWDGVTQDDLFSAGERIANIGGTTQLSADAVSSMFTALLPVSA